MLYTGLLGGLNERATCKVLSTESAAAAKLLQSCPTLCGPIDSSLPGFSVPGILQARILECVAMASSRGSSQARDQSHISYVSCIGRRVLYHCRHLGSNNSHRKLLFASSLHLCTAVATWLLSALCQNGGQPYRFKFPTQLLICLDKASVPIFR